MEAKGKTLRSAAAFIMKGISILMLAAEILILIPLAVPRIIGYQTYCIVSASMEPEIPIGSLILVAPTDAADLENSQIIAYYRNGAVICHRVVENDRYRGLLTTKGDANELADFESVEYTQVIGKVVWHVSRMGALGEYFSTTAGRLLAIEILVAAFLLNIIGRRLDPRERDADLKE